jgi:hypothetical protein
MSAMMQQHCSHLDKPNFRATAGHDYHLGTEAVLRRAVVWNDYPFPTKLKQDRLVGCIGNVELLDFWPHT